MNGLYKEIIEELEQARFYKALSKIKELKNQDGITSDLLMLLYFTYDLMFFMSQHQQADERKYKKLRDYYFDKLTNKIKGKDVVYLNLSIFLGTKFTTYDQFVWFDKNNEILHLVDKALRINPNNKEAKFYKSYFSGEINEYIDLLLDESFEDSFLDEQLSKISFGGNFKEASKKKTQLLEANYKRHRGILRLFMSYCCMSEQYEKAYALFEENPELKDPNKIWHCDFGRICMELEKYDEALVFFKEQGKTNPNYIDMAKCYEKLNHTDKAIKNYKKACIHFSGGRWTDAPDALLRLNAYKELKEALEQSEGHNKSFYQDSIKLYQAQLSYFNGNYKTSIEKLNESVPLLEEYRREKPEEWYLYQALNNCEIVLDSIQKDYESILNKQDFNLNSSQHINYSHYAPYHNYQEYMEKLNLQFNYKYSKQEAELNKKISSKYEELNKKLYQQAKNVNFELNKDRELFYLSFFDGKNELDQRIEIYKAKLKSEPNNPQWVCDLGVLLIDKYEYSEAEKYLLIAIKLAKKYLINLYGKPELTLIRLNNIIGKKNITENSRLFETSMAEFITHSSYEASIFTVFLSGTLYKYKTFSINTIASLTNDYLFFSDSKKFNDPFDVNTRLIPKLFDDSLEVDNTLFKSFSLAKNNDNPLMWAHYADEHNGICIGYKFDYLPSFIGKGEIEYKKTLLKENSTFNSLSAYWLTKGEDWEYEKEVRLLHFGKEEKIAYCFDKEQALNNGKISVKITEIAIGLWFSKENEKTLSPIIKQLEKRQHQKIKIFKATKDPNHPLKITIVDWKLKD